MNEKEHLKEKMQSAVRIRQIRENAGFTQEQFAEMLGISSSAYKKVESGENHISLPCLKKLHKEMSVSADYVLFGEKSGMDDTWEAVLNCSEKDKLFLLIKLWAYFSEIKKGIFPLKEEQSDYDKEILQLFKKLQTDGED